MSVHKRFRTETKLQFLITGLELQVELTKFVMKDKFIPKKYRLLLGADIIRTVDELVDNITDANSIFPDSDEKLKMREILQIKAIGDCYKLHNKIVRLEKCVETVKIDNLGKIIELLSQETALIKKWKKSDKVITTAEKEY